MKAATNIFSTLAAILTPLLGIADDAAQAVELKDGSTTTITCRVAKDEKFYIVGYDEKDKEISNDSHTGTDFHYKLYIPEGYNSNPKAYYPCMFIASPGGNANMGAMAARLRRDKWIAVMLVESKNGNPLWRPNFIAAYDDVVKRVRVAKGAKFATGFSGGARCSSSYPLLRPGFVGVLCQGAAFLCAYGKNRKVTYGEYPANVAVSAAFGNKDFNFFELCKIWSMLPEKSSKRVDFFEGGHQASPANIFERDLDWIEERVFVDKPIKARSTDIYLKGGTGAEQLSPEAYLWYFNTLKKRFDSESSKYGKLLISENMKQVALNGKILNLPSVNGTLAEISKVTQSLKSDQEIYKETLTKTDYLKVQKIYDNLDLQISKREFQNLNGITSKDKKLFEEYSAACDAFIARHPDSYYSKKLEERRTPLKYVFQKE